MVASLVIVGLAGAVLASAVAGAPSDQLPGVALGSELLLLVERTLAFFAAWMIVVIVIGQALKGRLPTEISSQGVRYAEAESVQVTTAEVQKALRRLGRETRGLHGAISRIERKQRRRDVR
jgi:uncharacterized membrane protein